MPAIGHEHEIARRAEVVDAAQEGPGVAAVVGMEHLAPHHTGGIALAAGDAQDPTARQQVSARIEPAVADERDARVVVVPVGVAERVVPRDDVGHEMELAARVRAAIDERTAMRVVLVDREQEHQQAAVGAHEGGLDPGRRGQVIERDEDRLAPRRAAVAREARGRLRCSRSRSHPCCRSTPARWGSR